MHWKNIDTDNVHVFMVSFNFVTWNVKAIIP